MDFPVFVEVCETSECFFVFLSFQDIACEKDLLLFFFPDKLTSLMLKWQRASVRERGVNNSKYLYLTSERESVCVCGGVDNTKYLYLRLEGM